MTEVVELKEKRVVILNPQRMGLREERRQDWVVNAEMGTKIEDVLDPQYWAHIAKQITEYARIEVLEETGEWLLDLLVINKGPNWAQVHVLHRFELVQRSDLMPAALKHEVVWKGPQLKWCVIRIADSEAIQKELASKIAAGEWLAAYERTVGT